MGPKSRHAVDAPPRASPTNMSGTIPPKCSGDCPDDFLARTAYVPPHAGRTVPCPLPFAGPPPNHGTNVSRSVRFRPAAKHPRALLPPGRSGIVPPPWKRFDSRQREVFPNEVENSTGPPPPREYPVIHFGRYNESYSEGSWKSRGHRIFCEKKFRRGMAVDFCQFKAYFHKDWYGVNRPTAVGSPPPGLFRPVVPHFSRSFLD